MLAADASPTGGKPREILSPALVRNGHGTFHVVVSAPRGEEFSLFVVQNPFGALQLNLYRERYEKRGEAWIPDPLSPVALSYTGHLPDPAAQVEDQTHMAFLLDIFVPPRAAVRRYRVEAQLLVRGRYIIYPMEVRVSDPAPSNVKAVGTVAAVDAGADASAASALQDQACGSPPHASAPAPGPLTIRDAILRNAREDMAIARQLEAQRGGGVIATLLGLDGKLAAWCTKPQLPARERGAEWYLRVRDVLYRIGREPAAPVETPPELKVPVLD